MLYFRPPLSLSFVGVLSHVFFHTQKKRASRLRRSRGRAQVILNRDLVPPQYFQPSYAYDALNVKLKSLRVR